MGQHCKDARHVSGGTDIQLRYSGVGNLGVFELGRRHARQAEVCYISAGAGDLVGTIGSDEGSVLGLNHGG